MIAGKTMIVGVILTMTDAVQEEHSRGLAPTGVAVSHPQAQSVPSSVIAIVVGVVMDATVTVASQRMKMNLPKQLLLLPQQLPNSLTAVPRLPNHPVHLMRLKLPLRKRGDSLVSNCIGVMKHA